MNEHQRKRVIAKMTGKDGKIKYNPISDNKQMANGQRNLSKTPLTVEEIEFVKKEIIRIEADKDMDIFIFNDAEHLSNIFLGTGYDLLDDKIYITKNVFPDDTYGSTHPRDLMSVGAVLAHEYYGHRPYRDEYLKDYKITLEQGETFHTTPVYQDECRASINASKLAPNLTELDKQHLILDAVYHAKEYGQFISLDDYMKGVLYGSYPEKPIVPVNPQITPIVFVSEESVERNIKQSENNCNMSKMPESSEYKRKGQSGSSFLPL